MTVCLVTYLNLCKITLNIQEYHIKDVRRTGGILLIFCSLAHGSLLHTSLPTVHSKSITESIANWILPKLTMKTRVHSVRLAQQVPNLSFVFS
uniref:dihydroxy-acid dehydratase n=1 Tax=Candidatus Pseudomonas adelgestsugas TaxID=1302376 RepID=UPI0013005F41|nr:dihydroxy-acid dehydratase [Candidatus Pseudomonas adelgestsugas]